MVLQLSWLEHLTHNQGVLGSSPSGTTREEDKFFPLRAKTLARSLLEAEASFGEDTLPYRLRGLEHNSSSLETRRTGLTGFDSVTKG